MNGLTGGPPGNRGAGTIAGDRVWTYRRGDMAVRHVLSDLVGAGATVGSGVASLGVGVGRRTVGVAEDLTGAVFLRAVDRALAWRYTAEALDLALRSSAAERAVDSLLDGPLVDATARAAGRHAVVERVAAQVVDSPDFERVVMTALESEGVQRLVVDVLESRMLDDLVQKLLESDDVWRLVDGIVSSPAVTAAVTQTSRGLADDVAEEVRTRSRGADAWLERMARRVTPHRREGRATTAQPATGDP
jgi:hypothetical protein